MGHTAQRYARSGHSNNDKDPDDLDNSARKDGRRGCQLAINIGSVLAHSVHDPTEWSCSEECHGRSQQRFQHLRMQRSTSSDTCKRHDQQVCQLHRRLASRDPAVPISHEEENTDTAAHRESAVWYRMRTHSLIANSGKGLTLQCSMNWSAPSTRLPDP
jgi:hypothetical protein